jgi:hypothetical protein
MKRVLITAGTVYGPLDANKLVSNRVRGIWALGFADWLVDAKHYDVTVLVPDTMSDGMIQEYVALGKVIKHNGFEDYRAKCVELAKTHDAAVMAAAVVNWIPKEPFPGKMPTKGYKAGDIVNIPFYLAPHVIDEMKTANPSLTLIGCKMLVNETDETLIEAAYGVLLKAKCNAVVANDMGRGLRRKLVVNQDRSVQVFDDDFSSFYDCLMGHLEDEHYKTSLMQTDAPISGDIKEIDLFKAVVAKHREGFTVRQDGSDKVFGSVLVPDTMTPRGQSRAYVSPREKDVLDDNPVHLEKVFKEERLVKVCGHAKATLNAPLLLRVLEKYPWATAVLHQHRQLPGVPTVPYYPPGTARDNEREIPGMVFNIEGHGFIACLDKNLDMYRVLSPLVKLMNKLVQRAVSSEIDKLL